MGHSKKIFLAFSSQDIEQTESIFEIQDGYECWNLKKFTFDTFIEAIKAKIPPINGNVLRHYKAEAETHDLFTITERQFKECTWGLLIPDGLDDVITTSYSEVEFLINLYSPTFLYPFFIVGDMGIMSRTENRKNIMTISHFQNQSNIFKKKDFVSFFKMLLPQSQYSSWQLDRVQKWQKEDWRLFVASYFFYGLRKYDNSKSAFGWQRESADIAASLEALFTADDSKNEEISYRLRKRIAVLLSSRFPSIEKDISNLYAQRSAFVHGSFFAQIAKSGARDFNDLPSPDFNELYKQKEYLRLALVGYLHLAQLIKSKPTDFGNTKNVMRILEQAIIDIALRQKLTAETERIFSLMPTPSLKLI